MTEDEFNKIYDPNITKRDYDTLKSEIEKRVSDVVHLFGNSWYDFGNSWGEKDGFFDENEYAEYIDVITPRNLPAPYVSDSGGGLIPTRWLWTDNNTILSEIANAIRAAKIKEEKEKAKAKAYRENRKAYLKQMADAIRTKLTKEELKCITFKK